MDHRFSSCRTAPPFVAFSCARCCDGLRCFHRFSPPAHLSAVPDRDPFADVSASPIKAYQAYQAALEDPHRSCADLARLTGTLKLERQSDRERARYYRMQEGGLPFWLIRTPALTPLTTTPPASCPLCMGDVSRSLAPLHFRYGRLGIYFTLRALCLYVLSILSSFLGVGRLPLLHPVNREAVTRTFYAHIFMLFLCVLYFSFTYSSIFRERESSETILLFSDSGGSEVEPCEDGARPVTGSPFIGPPEPFFYSHGVNPKNEVFLWRPGGTYLLEICSPFLTS